MDAYEIMHDGTAGNELRSNEEDVTSPRLPDYEYEDGTPHRGWQRCATADGGLGLPIEL